MPEPAIEIRGLARSFGRINAVDGLDLTVWRGEMFGIVGPDGAGKTTALRLLCGILKPSSGSARILGHDLAEGLDSIKPRIGYLSQRSSLYGDLTVDENIEFFAGIHQVRNYRRKRDELLEFTRLTPFRDRLSDRLSGGMKQKLALACTLVHTPEVIFLDEPTTGVDPVSRRDFWKILAGLLRSGITILMATPYLDEAERCTRVGMMSRGRLMAQDTPAGLRRIVAGAVVELVCDQVRRAFGILQRTPGVTEVQAFGDRLNALVPDADAGVSRLQERLREEGIPVTGCRVIPPSLENVFISLLKTEQPSNGKRET